MNHKNTGGFTLIELLIYITLVAGVLIMATSFTWRIIDSRTKAFSAQEVEQNGRLIIDKVLKAAYSAVDIDFPDIGENSDRLIMQTSDPATNPTIFYLTGGDLVIKRKTDGPYNLNSQRVEVTDVVFENLSKANGKVRNVQVTITLNYINPSNDPGRRYSNTYQTTIELKGR